MENLTNSDVKLKPIGTSDPITLFKLTEKNREYLRKTLPWLDGIKDENDSKKFIEDFIKRQENGEGVAFEIWYKDSFVGIIDFHRINIVDKNAQIGYWIDEDYQKKGIVTVACRLLIKYGFETLDLHRIEIHCAVDNPGSGAVANKLGFTKEGILYQSAWLYDHFQDMELWGLLK